MSREYPMPARNPVLRSKHAGWVADQIAALPFDRDYVVTIKPATKDRTPPQNRLLHKYLGIIAKETGNDPESVKDSLVRHFLGLESETVVGGVVIPRRRSTAKLSTKECAEFCDQLRARAAEFGLLLPLPGEFEE